MRRGSKVLLGLLLFNGLSAAVGSLALMTDGLDSRAGVLGPGHRLSQQLSPLRLMAVL
jgi:hypothetical protein